MKLITTSWDDGHLLDFKLAELLAKYNLPATFYIPQSNAERPVMGEKDIKVLSQSFEIGGHTLHHVRLFSRNKEQVRDEVKGCYDWLSQLLGKAPASFCFPVGAYNEAALQIVFKAGFTVARTTELFTMACYKQNAATATTLQAYPHTGFTYTKHLVKRRRWPTLLHWIKNGRPTDLIGLTESYLERINRDGGCFHLWGHSWEIEKYNLWKTVETLFKILADRSGFTYVQNRELAASSATPIQDRFQTPKKSEK